MFRKRRNPIITIVVLFAILSNSTPVNPIVAAPNNYPYTRTPSDNSTAYLPIIRKPQQVTLHFWEQEDDIADALLDDLIHDFELTHPNTVIKRIHFTNDDLLQQFESASLLESPPEVVRVPNDFTDNFVEPGFLAEIGEIIEPSYFDDFIAGSLEAVTISQTIWGLPDNYGNHLMLFYNKDLIPTPPLTFDELITQALTLTTGDIQGFAYNLNEPSWGAGFWGAFGGWPLDEYDQPQFDQTFVDYLIFVKSLKDNGVVSSECDFTCADFLFRSGQMAMIINGEWTLGDYYLILRDKLGTAPVPPINGHTYTEMTSGKYYMVAAPVQDDPVKKAAVAEFILYMTSSQAQQRWLETFGRLPSNKSVANDPLITSDPLLAGSMAALANGRGYPPAKEMICALNAWRPNLEGVMQGTLSPEEAAQAAQLYVDMCDDVPVTLAFWEQESDEVDDFIDDLIAEFEVIHPFITVSRTHYANEDLRDQFMTASLAEAPPEVVRVPNDFTYDFAEPGFLAEMSAIVDPVYFNEFFAGSLEPATLDQTIWGLPDNYGNHLMLYYNKDLIASPPLTFEELITQALTLTVGDIQGFAFNLNEPFWGAGFWGAFGGWPLDEYDQPQFDNQTFVDYLTFVKSLKINGVVPEECDYACADTLFKDGQAAMIINGDWAMKDYDQALGDKLGTAPVPPINGHAYTEMTAGKYYMVSSPVIDDPDKKAAVAKFVLFMTSAQTQRRWLETFGKLPSNISVANDPLITGDPLLAGSMAALANGRGMPPAKEMRCAWNAWRPNLEGVMQGSLSPQDAAQAAQEAADDCIATLYPHPTSTPILPRGTNSPTTVLPYWGFDPFVPESPFTLIRAFVIHSWMVDP